MAARSSAATLGAWNFASANSTTRPGERDGAQATRAPSGSTTSALGSHWAEFAGNRQLTELLLDLRERLGHADPRRALRQFHPPGLA
jgi:hypothetical protein